MDFSTIIRIRTIVICNKEIQRNRLKIKRYLLVSYPSA